MVKRILHVGFGYEPYWEGGMVTYQLDMMRGLKEHGFQIAFFAAGRYDIAGTPRLSRATVEGVPIIELVNSPNPYNPYCYSIEPDRQCANKGIEGLTREVIETVRPDLVHMHDLRMHSASVIDVAREFALPVVKTMHNFWDLCPRDSLLYRDRESCNDFQDGEKCVDCLADFRERQVPVINRLMGAVRMVPVVSFLKRIQKGERIIRRLRRKGPARQQVFSARDYARRRSCFVEKLNRCDIVHTTSNYVAEQFAARGIERRRIRTATLAVSLLDRIGPRADRPVKHPITFGYRGAISHAKGVPVLLAAFARLDQSKCRLVIYGPGERRILRGSGGNLNMEYRGKYGRARVQDSLADIDIGVVPSLCAEAFGIVGLEFLNAGIPVIGSRIGGIPEWLKNGENGFLVEPGSVGDLAAKMERFLIRPALVRELRARIERWKTVADHIAEISDFYEELLSRRRPMPGRG